MHKYIARRILQFIPMLFLVTVLVFALAMAAPGDPLSGERVDPNIDPAVYEERREALGLNDPIPVQYWRWLTSVAQGNFGDSLQYTGRSVMELIQARIWNTFYLSIFALAVTLAIAIPIGIYSANRKYSLFDYGATTFAFLGLATPNFFAGLLAIYVFALTLGWFPAQGTTSAIGLSGFELFIDKLRHLVLPGLTLGLASTAAYMRYMRTEVLEVKGSDFIRTAKAKGLSNESVLYKHTLRNALIPIITLLGLEFGTLLSGAIITERIFNYPGLGTLFLNAITNRDYPVIMAINLILAVTILVGNLLADIFYAIVDPRIRYD
ncbi:ABC transporter permease [Evansella cellulosilytica]|uniref:Binding-protein-dependent transport systems inner membrane component n=1 Tax=Evansella cellulosilytica (strain ATCC 21833 / DSM 2522 / FERM P-1141 / JCM 9156 / N-4) TaxID=649639 RepID=E6TRL7_EVAC2|nr:ABC transporter permease [Evansella cellulosilytica]ADU28311.1 binding-protein-dependent transport systems inner membrane component [Evansella cellulosilytica DSM 2522]